MREDMYEETSLEIEKSKSKRKYYIFKTLSIISAVLGFILLFVFLNFVDLSFFNSGNVLFIVISLLLYILPFLLCFVFAILFYKWKFNYCVDYDYIFVSGSVRISKVIKDYMRRHIITFNTSEIEKLGRVGSEEYYLLDANKTIKKMILTSNSYPEENKEFYYLLLTVNGEKKLIIIEATSVFMKHVISYSNRYVIEKGF